MSTPFARSSGEGKAIQSESGRLARAMAVAMATTHLQDNRDVVVPQLIARPPFLEALAATAAFAGATFHEIVLVADRREILDRLAARETAPSEPGRFNHRDLVAAAGGLKGVGSLHDRLMDFLATRPRAQVVPSQRGRPDHTYAEVLRLLDEGPAHPPG